MSRAIAPECECTARRACFVRLCDEAVSLATTRLPICAVREGRVPGRAMPVALQGHESPARE